jgi:exopolysaccharide biosynthesis polyprenyl glycosylphosphotransferase
MYQKRSKKVCYTCLLIDFVCILVAIVLAVALRDMSFDRSFSIFKNGVWIVILLIYALVYFLTNSFHHFFKRDRFDEFVNALKQNLIYAVALIVVLFFMKAEAISRLAVIYFLIIDTLLMCLAHICLRNVCNKSVGIVGKKSGQCILLVNEKDVEDVIGNMLANTDFKHNLAGFVVYDADYNGRFIKGIKCVAAPGGLIDYCKCHVVDEVFVHLNDVKDEHITRIVQELNDMGINAMVNIKAFDWELTQKRTIEKMGYYTVLVFSNNIVGINQLFCKRLLDIIGSIVGLIGTAVASIFIVPAIAVEDGFPVIFKQKRVGKNGRIFNFYKFRSMYKDAEERKKDLMDQNQMSGLMFKLDNDPRITKVGGFIRKTSLDELPQFWNVLKGDMSLVGTRPPTVGEYENYEPYHKKRLSFKPGITGNWQVSGRSDITDFEEVVRLDTEYIENWSFKEDIRIIFQTIKVVLLQRGSK